MDLHCRLYAYTGSSKTRIARAFARRLQEALPDVHILWVYARTEERIGRSYAEIAIAAGLSTPECEQVIAPVAGLHTGGEMLQANAGRATPDIVQLVTNWLRSDQSSKWFLVVDSADSHSTLQDGHTYSQASQRASGSDHFNLAHIFPQSPKGAILMTTRNRKLAGDLTDNLIEVPRMAFTEAEIMVKNKLGHTTFKPEEIQSLITLLEHLLLALIQALAYIRKASITIGKYLQLYQKDKSTKIRLLERDFGDTERDQEAENAIVKTWTLSFEQIKVEHSQAADLLCMMSYLDAQSVPEALLQVEIPDSLDLEDALATLKGFALITADEQGEHFDMHRMVQLSTRRWLDVS